MIADIFGMDGIVVLVVVLVVLFGGSQIPKLARSLGTARKEFDQGLHEHHDHQEQQELRVPLAPGGVEAAKVVVTGEVVSHEGVNRKDT